MKYTPPRPDLLTYRGSSTSDPFTHQPARAHPLSRSPAMARRGPIARPAEDALERDLRKLVAQAPVSEVPQRSLLNKILRREPADHQIRERHGLQRVDIHEALVTQTYDKYCRAALDRAEEQIASARLQFRIAKRREDIEHATYQLHCLRESIERSREEFMGYIRRRCQRLEDNADLAALYDAECVDIHGELERQLATLRELEAMFLAAITDRLG